MKKVVDRILHQPTHTHTHNHIHNDIKHASVEHIDSSGMVVHRKVETAVEETVLRPTIVEETQIEKEVIEVQPIIHRVIEVPEVHHIERHVYEKVVPVGPTTITREPIIDVTIQPRIIEEVTTIVHREVPEVYVVHEEEHISEHQTRPVIHTTTVYNDTSSIETITTDSHLRAIAEPHERVHPQIMPTISESAWENATPHTQWVAAYPKAMLAKQAHSGHHAHSAHHAEKHVEASKLTKSSKPDESEKKQEMKGKLEKGKEVVKDTLKEKTKASEKEPTKTWTQAIPKAMEKLQETKTEEEVTLERRNAKGKERVIEHREEIASEATQASQALADANSPEGAHEQDSGPSLDHPVFVYREPEHNSLDIRAQFSLERAADLQAMNAYGDLPAFSGKPHSVVDRGNDDLERGSTIGLSSPTLHHNTAPPKQKQAGEPAGLPTLKPEKEKPTPTKLEKELRKHNTDMAGAFVVSSLQPEH